MVKWRGAEKYESLIETKIQEHLYKVRIKIQEYTGENNIKLLNQ